MFSNWRMHKLGEKGVNRRRASRRVRRGVGARQLRLEPLELRALLNGGPFGHHGHQPSPTTVQLALVLPQTVQAGQTVTAEVATVNSQRYVVASSDTIDLSTTSPGVVLPASVTLQQGTAYFPVTFNTSTAGVAVVQDVIAATDAANSQLSLTASVSVVNPKVVTQIVLSGSSTATAGTADAIQAQALNALGQRVTTCQDPLAVVSSDTGAQFTPQSVSFVNGVANFQVTFQNAGYQSVTATDNSLLTPVSSTGWISVAANPSPNPNPTPNPNPSPVTATTSSNWSGYAAQTNLNNPQSGAVTAVGGNWTVPAVSGPSRGVTYSSVWVGIDGYSSNSVEQLGTEEDWVNGAPQYSAWYEIYPNYPVTINMAVSPGDKITASVNYEGSGQFLLSMTDLTTGQSFSTTQVYAQAQRSSAEWIVEAPSSNSGVLPLASFGTVSFSNCTATINGVTGPIDNSTWQPASINMAARSVTEDVCSGLTDSGGASAFTVTYKATASTNSSASWAASPQSSPMQVPSATAVPPAPVWVPAPVPRTLWARDMLFAALDAMEF
jgi:hypothetical protein